MISESHLLLGEDEIVKKQHDYYRNIRRCFIGVLSVIVFMIIWNYLFTSISYTDIVKKNIAEMLEQTEVVNYQPINGTIRPFYNTYSFYPVLQNYNLAACYTPKVMATTLAGIFCYLTDTEGFNKRKLNMKKVYWNTPFCNKIRPEFKNTAIMHDKIQGKLRKFVIYRHPIARFVSAFVNKCVNELAAQRKYNTTMRICFNCNDNLDCVVRRSYQLSMSLSRGERFLNQFSWADSYAFVHFSPESWDCDISRQYKDFTFVRYASNGQMKKQMAEDIMNVFEESGIEKWKLDEIRPVIYEDKPLTHATRGSELPHKLLKQLYNSPLLLDTLSKLYYYDFKLFDFPMPKVGELPPHDM